MWCVDAGNGTLVTIGNPEVCPGSLVCDDTQAKGCVLSNIVSTTEIITDFTTATAPTTDSTTTTVSVTTTVATINTTDSSTTEELSTVPDADFTCTYEALYRAQDCSRFHVCYRWIWFIKYYFARCSRGLYWSSLQKRCVLQSLSDCP